MHIKSGKYPNIKNNLIWFPCLMCTYVKLNILNSCVAKDILNVTKELNDRKIFEAEPSNILSYFKPFTSIKLDDKPLETDAVRYFFLCGVL